MIYEYKAENISRPQLVKLVRELEAEGVEVEHANMDAWFTNHVLLVVTCAGDMATKIKNRIWKINNGLFCDMYSITQEQLNEYIGE
jgi:hypothetical protein